MTNMRSHIFLFIALLSTNLCFTQQLDPIHYPQESEWQYLKTKQTDSLLQVMKFYFNSNDTLFFREALSQQVVKVALTDLQIPGFYLGTRYVFADRFYGPGGETASRTSKNEKLDRFYYYYLNAPELRFSKEAPHKEVSQEIKTEVVQVPPSPSKQQNTQPDNKQKEQPNTSNYSALQPQIVLKNGCVLHPEKLYFLSDGQLYFGNGVSDNIYKVDTAAVQAVIGFEVGKNLELMTRSGYAFGGRCMRFVGIVLGAINVGIVASSLSWDFSTGMGFFGTIPTGIIYVKLIINGTTRILNKKRFRNARYVQCAN
jgi:hypothetical protein